MSHYANTRNSVIISRWMAVLFVTWFDTPRHCLTLKNDGRHGDDTVRISTRYHERRMRHWFYTAVVGQQRLVASRCWFGDAWRRSIIVVITRRAVYGALVLVLHYRLRHCGWRIRQTSLPAVVAWSLLAMVFYMPAKNTS